MVESGSEHLLELTFDGGRRDGAAISGPASHWFSTGNHFRGGFGRSRG